MDCLYSWFGLNVVKDESVVTEFGINQENPFKSDTL